MGDLYTVIIGEGAQEHTFQSERTRFVPRISNNFTQQGILDSTVETYTMAGMLIGAGPNFAATTMTLWKALREVAKRKTAQRFRVLRNSTVEIDLQTASMLAGPFVQLFDVVPTGGAFANHVRYALSVQATSQGGGLFPTAPNVQNLRRTIEEEDFDGEAVRKIWTATAQGKDALRLVRSFEPTGTDPLRRIIRRELDTGVASARYVFEAEDDPAFLFGEVITQRGLDVRPPIPVLIEPGKAGQPPLIFKGRRRPIMVTLNGTASGPEKAKVKVPSTRHFSQDALLPEQTWEWKEPQILSKADGTYHIKWQEAYVFASADEVGAPNHGAHAPKKKKKQAADGNMAGA